MIITTHNISRAHIPSIKGTKMLFIVINAIIITLSAQGWTNRTLAVHERTSVHFLVLPGSLLSITEITEYRYFSP